VATDADTKLVPSWYVGGRDKDAAIILMDDLASRLAGRIQLTTDSHVAYADAVEEAGPRTPAARDAGSAHTIAIPKAWSAVARPVLGVVQIRAWLIARGYPRH
jgi:hypothetical protein